MRHSQLVKHLSPKREYALRMPVDEKKLAADLRKEGFRHTYVWQDGPNAHYAEHTHNEETAHIILSGEMTLTMNGESRTFCAGERCDVPALAAHSAHMGPRGCRYLIGER
jgi:mannose-6-phosphate isomerase-like protein (cupin superfamily)